MGLSHSPGLLAPRLLQEGETPVLFKPLFTWVSVGVTKPVCVCVCLRICIYTHILTNAADESKNREIS